MTAPSQEATAQKRQRRNAQKRAARSATNHIDANHPNISRASHSVAAITKSSERAPNISAARLSIEKYLSNLRPGETASTKQIATACSVHPTKTGNILQSLAGDGFAVNISQRKNCGQWRMTTNTKKSSETTAKSSYRICNGNQPNGTRAYWQAFERQRMTPARLELLPYQEMTGKNP